MNFLFRTFVFFGGLIVVALFAALIAPYWINWQQFTDEFEAQATRVIGQKVNVGGDTKLRLLPLPFISFEGLEVGEGADGTPLMTIDRFSLKAELLPFLSGKVRIVEMAMHKPRLDLAVEENGTVAWTTPSEPIVDPEQVKIERLVVEDGSASISGLAGGRTLEIENLEADLAARSVLGPWSIDGSGEVEGIRSLFSISTGSYQAGQKSVRLRISVRRDDRPYELEMDGPLRLKENVLTWSGNFGVDPLPAVELADLNHLEVPLPVSLDGAFSATPEKIDVPEYRLEVGDPQDPYVVTGNAQAEIKEKVFFRLQADGRQIDLDRIRPANDVKIKSSNLEARLEALRSVLDRVPVPDAQGEIDVLLPAIVAGDTFIRDIKAIIRPYERGWDVRLLTAQFPGNTTLEASGRVGLENDFGFSGRLLIASRQPSGFADWISGEVSPQIRRLRAVGLESRVTISSYQARFDNLELRLDDALLTGRLQWIGSRNAKPAIIAELAGNRINTEDLHALYSLARSEADNDLSTHDLNLNIRAGLLEANILDLPVEAQDVDASVQVRDGSVSVERFNATNLFGATFESAGRIEDVLYRPNGNLKLKVRAEQGQRLFEFLNRLFGELPALAHFAQKPELVEGLSLEIEVDTTSTDESAKGIALIKGGMSGTELDARVSFEGPIGDRANLPLDFSGRFTNPDPSILLQQIGLETFPVDLAGDVDGPMRMVVSTKGSMSDGLQSQLGFTAPGTNLTMEGKLVLDQSLRNPSADIATTFGSGDVLPWMRLLGLPVPYDGAGELPVSARLQLVVDDEKALANDLAGQIASNEFSGSLKLEKEGRTRPRLTGNLTLDYLSTESLAEFSLGRFEGSRLVGQLLPDEELSFSEPLYPEVDARIGVSADKITLGSTIDGREGNLEFVMIDGAVDLNGIEFKTMDGSFSGDASLKNTNGTVLARGSFLMNGFDIEELASGFGFAGSVSGKAKLSASLETSGLSVAGLATNLNGNGFIQADGLEFSGLNTGKFSEILAATDVEGYEIKTDKVVKLVEDTLLDGELSVDELAVPLSITRGRLRVRNVAHQSADAELTGNLEVELLSKNAEADLSVAFVPGRRDAISGAEPQLTIRWTGPLGALERSIDASQLEGYLSLRAFETSQRRLETLEARVIEKQRHMRQIALSFAREQKIRREEEAARVLLEQKRLEQEEAERKKAEEQARQEAEERAAEEARLKQEAEEREAARVAEEERSRLEAERAAEEERLRLEAERQAEEDRLKEEEERQRLEAEQLAEEERLKEEEERIAAEQRAAVEAADIVAPTPAPAPNRSGIRETPLLPVQPSQPRVAVTPEPTPTPPPPKKPSNLLEALERLLSPR